MRDKYLHLPKKKTLQNKTHKKTKKNQTMDHEGTVI